MSELTIEPGDERKLTDAAGAELFATRYAESARYNHSTKTWWVFEDGHWVESNKGAVEQFAKRLADPYFDVASELGKSGQGEWSRRVFKFALHLLSASGIRGLLYAAQSELPVGPDEFDSHPLLFNVKNVTLELFRHVDAGQAAFVARPPHPNDLLTKQADVEYQPTATCPRFDCFLHETFEGDQELIAYVLRLFGSCLAGGNPEHVFPFFWGEGANGKSTLLNLMRRMFGEYGQTLSAHALLNKRSGAATNDIADLRGIRLAICTELPSNANVDTTLLKSVSGGDNLRGRRLHQNNVEFTPEALMIAATNSKPNLPVTDDAIWRRVHLVPFKYVVAPAQRDPELPLKLWEERSGILNRLLAGYAGFVERGLDTPNMVNAATAAFRDELDLVKRFVDECCETGAGATHPAGALRKAYVTWCQQNGDTPTRDFKQRMQGLGYPQKREGGGFRYIGITLRDDATGALPHDLPEAA